MNVRDVDTLEFDEAVVARSRQVPVVVDFWATWCGPCRVLGPMLERLAAASEDRWELVKVDVDRNPQLAAQLGVQGIPTVIGFRDGRPAAQFTGAVPEAAVQRFLDELVPSELDLAAEQGRLLLEGGDEAGAESAWQAVLAGDPSHAEAGTGLAGLLIDRGEPAAALEVLARLAPTDEVRRLQAVARIGEASGDLERLAEEAADEDNPAARLAYGRALAAAGRHEEALEALLSVVSARAEDVSEQARQAMVDLFDMLGDSPLVATYRRKLASALF